MVVASASINMRLLHLRQRVGGGFGYELRTQREFHGFGFGRSVSTMQGRPCMTMESCLFIDDDLPNKYDQVCMLIAHNYGKAEFFSVNMNVRVGKTHRILIHMNIQQLYILVYHSVS